MGCMFVGAARTWDMVHDPVLENSQTHDELLLSRAIIRGKDV